MASGSEIHSVKDQEDFQEQLKNAGSKLVVVVFTATRCGPCNRIAPVLEKMASDDDFSKVVFLKVDIDENEELVSEYNITSRPTFVFIRNSKKVFNVTGASDLILREMIFSYK